MTISASPSWQVHAVGWPRHEAEGDDEEAEAARMRENSHKTWHPSDCHVVLRLHGR